jgi:hypothetical protein
VIQGNTLLHCLVLDGCVTVTKGSTLHILTSNTREFPSIKGIQTPWFPRTPIDHPCLPRPFPYGPRNLGHLTVKLEILGTLPAVIPLAQPLNINTGLTDTTLLRRRLRIPSSDYSTNPFLAHVRFARFKILS